MNKIPIFESLVEEGFLRKSENGDLVLYGYTDKCTFDKHWTKETKKARGIILDKKNGSIVAKPFEKFFNLGETEETFLINLPNENYTVHEKLDGSLGIIFYYDNKWNICTRGSFYSDQAVKGAELLNKYEMTDVPSDITLLVEIIYPENKIVVNYGSEEKLVLLGAFVTKSEIEFDIESLTILSEFSGMPLAKIYNYTIQEMIQLQKILPKDEEGFVVHFQSGLRVKIKGDEYMKISKLISRMLPISFWECMENGIVKPEYLQQLPEEFRLEYEPIKEKLETLYKEIKKEVVEEFNILPIDKKESRKNLGLYLKSNKNIKHSGAMFHLLLNKNDLVDKYILNKIRPTGNQFNG